MTKPAKKPKPASVGEALILKLLAINYPLAPKYTIEKLRRLQANDITLRSVIAAEIAIDAAIRADRKKRRKSK